MSRDPLFRAVLVGGVVASLLWAVVVSMVLQLVRGQWRSPEVA